MRKNGNIRHIVYATDHNYAFVCAVSIASLLEYKNKDDHYIIYILTDGSLTSDDICLFDILEKMKPDCTIEVKSVSDEQVDKVDVANYHLTKMTYYRLLLPTLLCDVDKCLYLDSDTRICADISMLMNHDITNYYLAAVVDSDIKKVSYDNVANLNLDIYFNAGVLLMNLDKMREKDLSKQFFSLIDKEWPYRDQDILNKVCEDNVLLIDNRFNRFSYSVSENDNTVIVHYIGGVATRPWQSLTVNNGEKWWQIAKVFSEFDVYNEVMEEIQRYHNCGQIRYIVDCCSKYRNVYVFGSGYYGDKLVRSLQRNHVSNIAYVLDNNKSLYGKKIAGVFVMAPSDVEFTEDDLIIISIKNQSARKEIAEQLEQLKIRKQQIMFYEEKTSDEYYYMSPEYQAEERENVLLRELGSGTARLGWDLNKHG